MAHTYARSDANGEDSITPRRSQDLDCRNLCVAIHPSHDFGNRKSGHPIEGVPSHASIVQVEVQFKSMTATLTIAELHHRTGKPSSALRFYERENMLEPIGRQGGMRIYRTSAVKQVALIDLLQLAGSRWVRSETS